MTKRTWFSQFNFDSSSDDEDDYSGFLSSSSENLDNPRFRREEEISFFDVRQSSAVCAQTDTAVGESGDPEAGHSLPSPAPAVTATIEESIDVVEENVDDVVEASPSGLQVVSYRTIAPFLSLISLSFNAASKNENEDADSEINVEATEAVAVDNKVEEIIAVPSSSDFSGVM